MKTFRAILIGAVVVLVANALTWLLHGRESALLLGAEVEEVAYATGGIDTLYLFTGYFAHVERGAQFAEFAPETLSGLARELQDTGRTVVVDDRPFPLLDEGAAGRELLDAPGSRAFAYDVSVERPFPLVAEVYRLIWAPGFGAHESALYVWFFGWHHVRDTGSSVT
jgi:hypothetical protein